MVESDAGKFLIVAGTQKGGTTSLFRYLEHHPQIAPCREKEPLYFLPKDYPVPTTYRYRRDSFEKYLSLFPAVEPSRTRMEGSATYLHIPGAAADIKKCLPNAKIVITLREPISRLVSWYNMVLLFGLLEAGTTFDQYVRSMLDDRREMQDRPHHMRAIEHSCYAQYVSEYLSIFGAENVLTLWFPDLKRDPKQSMAEVCAFAGLDQTYFDNYVFTAHFDARKFRNRALFDGYEAMKGPLRRALGSVPVLGPALGKMKKTMEPAYYRLITKPADPVVPSPDIVAALKPAFLRDTQVLASVLQRQVPWETTLAAR